MYYLKLSMNILKIKTLKHEIYTHYYEIVTVHENWLAASVIHSSL